MCFLQDSTMYLFFITLFMKDIPGYEWLYAATEDGKIWSYPKIWFHKGKMLKPNLSQAWYYSVTLVKEGKHINKRVNRLIASTYLLNPNNYPVVKHKDNDKTNNHYLNLQWTTIKDNTQQAHDDWLCVSTQKHKDAIRIVWLSMSKQVAQYSIDLVLLKVWPSAAEVQRQLWFHNTAICCCRSWRIKTAYWYIWKYI